MQIGYVINKSSKYKAYNKKTSKCGGYFESNPEV
ncbi:hypothetical protein Fluta_0440 [Fluviicola taffensis DSM 16823]|uniref:Uncharacterized protein n=1 Tax=Fluviicola taffensis (strain DSM 16823 / NCIMB 13979 / RW262) TaxID=755732 RepID=F2IEY1_FLUTR|nr:hypothetical protein Fluta_0440 [Fluviicola taffensis DSM 16823]